MENALVVLFWVGGAVVLGGLAYLNYLGEKRRTEQISRFARSRGWTFAARDDSWVDRFDGRPFGIGSGRAARNVVTGTHDARRFVAFDYEYRTTEMGADGKVRTTEHEMSVVALTTKVVLPHLEVGPEGLVSRLLGRVTGSEIDLESEQFNRTFTVRCADRKFATDVLHPRMMEYLMRFPDLAWDLRNGTLMVVQESFGAMPLLDSTLTVIDGILDLVPDHVWKERGVEPPAPPLTP